MRFFTQLTTQKVIFLIALLGCIIYGDALFNGFVWDDNLFIINNPDVHSLNIIHLFGGNMFNAISYYRPLSALYFALLYNFFGSQAFFYHFFQIALHILNTVLVYLLLRTLFRRDNAEDASDKQWQSLSGSQRVKYMRKHGSDAKAAPSLNKRANVLAFFLSLLFLVHPINVESVAYIASSQSELLFLFGILALLISIQEKVSLNHLFFASGLLLLSLLTKEVGFLFLLMVLLFQLLFNKRRLLNFFAFGIATIIIYCFIRFTIGGVFFGKIITDTPLFIQKLPLLERLASIPAIVLYYLTTVLFPLHLAVAQKWVVTKLTTQNFYLPLLSDSLFFIALLLGGVYIFKHKVHYFKMYLFFSMWFLSGLLMLVQIFPLDLTVADRWFYFPLIGLLGLLGVGVQTLARYEKAIKIVALLGTMIILLFSLRTIIRNTNYHDEITLFTHDLTIHENVIMENDLGVDYAKTGNTQAALTYLQKSANHYPYPGNLFNLAYTYERTGDIQKAKEYYYKSLNVSESYFLTSGTNRKERKDNLAIYDANLAIYIRLGWVLLHLEEYAAAEKISNMGVQYYPDSDVLWRQLAIIENNLHDQQAALAAVEMVKKLAPNEDADLLHNIILSKQKIPPPQLPLPQ